MTANALVMDLFAGPGGWDEGIKPLGIHPVGIEWDDAACRTAALAGHTRVRADVETFPLDQLKGRVTGLIMSPPCQDFSLAGKRAGVEGEKGRLITQVLRWTDGLRPSWIACEQVPPCIDYWREYARIMRSWGYKTWHGIVNAADYGVPQTRKRAILLASLTRQPVRPERTHARGGDVDLFSERLPWITMAEALGWDGLVGFPRRADTPSTRASSVVTIGGVDYRERDLYPTDGPAQVVTEKARSWIMRGRDEPAPTVVTTRRSTEGLIIGRQLPDEEPSRAVGGWGWERPATTILAGSNRSSTELPNGSGAGSVRVSVEEAATLQSFRADYPWQGSRTKQFEQVGNAIPPRLALHVVAEVLGVAVPTEAVAA